MFVQRCTHCTQLAAGRLTRASHRTTTLRGRRDSLSVLVKAAVTKASVMAGVERSEPGSSFVCHWYCQCSLSGGLQVVDSEVVLHR
jgi:hypothetical protein